MADWQGTAAVTRSWVWLGALTAPGEPEAGVYGARCAAARVDGRCVRTCTRWAAGLLGPAPAAGGDAEEPCDWAGRVMGRGLVTGGAGRGLVIGADVVTCQRAFAPTETAPPRLARQFTFVL